MKSGGCHKRLQRLLIYVKHRTNARKKYLILLPSRRSAPITCSSKLSLFIIRLVSITVYIEDRITKQKIMHISSIFDLINQQKMPKGQIVNTKPAAIPQSQVSFILPMHAKIDNPTLLQSVITAATTISKGSNHWVNPATMKDQKMVNKASKM